MTQPDTNSKSDESVMTAEMAQLHNELDYAYGVIAFGFEYGSFDFSVLRQRAKEWIAKRPAQEQGDLYD